VLIHAIQAAAPSLGVEVRPINVRDADEIERAITAFARSSNGGLIVTAGSVAYGHREPRRWASTCRQCPMLLARADGDRMSYAPAFWPTLEDESLDKLGVEGVELLAVVS
jgi:hypothetical protein